ncbi:hypothetical protein K493DRAFT_29789 [Basidiobolus meristosporus CBS 931.73]|uniref:Uncharacterized protein n=1 Tax=Basidiobolus meristosporus CBS 931.73 TaxID=1314790 RepID=A0A1Y1YA33_9FUNG|nr:hypothetical protein K493DRAFT_29789 [Basidiobolus meristosporus CBS 931.73]|eukprot:ORX94616.1 hypothetical protein K493DRAFT_29789 [Basidiobolus meristosporus CBS 931.73]
MSNQSSHQKEYNLNSTLEIFVERPGYPIRWTGKVELNHLIVVRWTLISSEPPLLDKCTNHSSSHYQHRHHHHHHTQHPTWVE